MAKKKSKGRGLDVVIAVAPAGKMPKKTAMMTKGKGKEKTCPDCGGKMKNGKCTECGYTEK